MASDVGLVALLGQGLPMAAARPKPQRVPFAVISTAFGTRPNRYPKNRPHKRDKQGIRAFAVRRRYPRSISKDPEQTVHAA
jgi:hypothetical protein